MDTFRLERTGDRPIIFTGTRLAHQSSQAPGKTEWTELTIYLTDTGRYVAETIGRSVRPGRIDRRAVSVTGPGDAEAVVANLRQTDAAGVGYLTNIARAALAEAGEADTAISAALMERV